MVIAIGLIALSGCSDFAIRDTRSLLFPRFHKSEVYGFVAGFGTTFAAVPDLITMLKQQASTGINPRMAGILAVFQVIWIYYGFLIGSRPVIAWNAIAVVINSLGVAAYVYFASRERHARSSAHHQ